MFMLAMVGYGYFLESPILPPARHLCMVIKKRKLLITIKTQYFTLLLSC